MSSSPAPRPIGRPAESDIILHDVRVLAINARLGATGPGPSPARSRHVDADATPAARPSPTTPSPRSSSTRRRPSHHQRHHARQAVAGAAPDRRYAPTPPTTPSSRQRRHPPHQPVLDQMTAAPRSPPQTALPSSGSSPRDGGPVSGPRHARARADRHYDLSTTSVMRINLPVSQAVTVIISDPVGKIVAADPAIADAQPITDRSIYVVGKAFGTTTVNLYSAAGAPVGLLAVEVGADTADIAQLDPRRRFPVPTSRSSTVNGRVLLSRHRPRRRLDAEGARHRRPVWQPGHRQHHDPRPAASRSISKSASSRRSATPAASSASTGAAAPAAGRDRRDQCRSEHPPPTPRPSRPSSPTSSPAAASISTSPSTRSKPRASSAPSPIPTSRRSRASAPASSPAARCRSAPSTATAHVTLNYKDFGVSSSSPRSSSTATASRST